MIKFGPSGTGDSFEREGFSKTIEVPKWLKEKNLDCYEYSFGHGVRIGLTTAAAYGEEFRNQGIEISVHAPYFINMATAEEDKAVNNHRYILESIRALKAFGGNRCVFHPGSPLKRDRRESMDVLMKRMNTLLEVIYEENLQDTVLCVETMGKKNQLGDVDEIIEICARDAMLYPCIDFGHLNARAGGLFKCAEDYKRIIDKFIDGLGFDKIKNMHVHFSKIQYSDKGEVRHLTFADDIYGPEFEPLAEVIRDYALEPYIICESSGTQTEDALRMKQSYFNNEIKSY